MMKQLTIKAYKTDSYQAKDQIRGATFTALFNPSEYTLTRSNEYTTKASAGTSKPSVCYANGANDKLTITFLLDGTGVKGRPGPVTTRLNLLLGLMRYRGDLHRPAFVTVSWGSFKFKGVLLSATTQFTLFDTQGRPIRVKITAELEEAMSETDRLAIERTSSPDVNRVWMVRDGDRIDGIAAESYGDVRYWRQLAAANGLVNPRRLSTGEILHLPRLER